MSKKQKSKSKQAEQDTPKRTDYLEFEDHLRASDDFDNEFLRFIPPHEVLRLKDELKQRYFSNPHKLPTGANGILDFFQNLPVREKALIDTYNLLCTAAASRADNNDTAVKIHDAIADYAPDDVPTDLQWMIGAQQFAELIAQS